MLTLIPPDPPTVDLHIPHPPLVLATGTKSRSAARASWAVPAKDANGTDGAQAPAGRAALPYPV